MSNEVQEKKDIVLVNVSKNDTNVNVSVANSVLNWLADLCTGGKKNG